MSALRARYGFALAASLLVIPATQGPARAQGWDVELHVDLAHPAAADSNSGTPDAPLRTVAEAARRAVANKLDFRSTRVVVHAGTYRETVFLDTYTNFTGKPPNDTPMLFEAESQGGVVVSGSEVWTGWAADSATGHFTHAWPYDWGVYPDPTGGAREVDEIVRRREMIFVDGARLRQVLSLAELTAGSFFVDETADRVVVAPPSGVDLDSALVEVGIRERLWVQEWEDHVTVRGFVFRHAATHWEDAWAAVRVNGSRHAVLEDLTVEWNNGPGVYIGETDSVRVYRVAMDDNGWDGLRMWRIRGGLVEDCTTNRNNWRGDWGRFYGWSVGNKIHNTRRLMLRRHESVGNLSRGLWFDEDNEDLVLEAVNVSSNLGDGMFIEANQGPIRITRSRFNNNGAFGVLTSYSEFVTVTRSEFRDNADGAVQVSGGSNGRWVRNFETGVSMQLFAQVWTLNRNIVQDDTGTRVLLTTSLDATGWDRFTSTLESDFNTWGHRTRPDVFQVPPNKTTWTLEEWSAATGQDRNSTFESTTLAVELLGFSVHPGADRRAVELRWETAAETDNAGFEVQRYEAQLWKPIGFVAGEGTPAAGRAYSFHVEDLAPGVHYFRLKQVDVDGGATLSAMKEVVVDLAGSHHVGEPFPNPFGNRTVIPITVHREQHVRVEAFDVQGRPVAVLHDGPMSGGFPHPVVLDGGGLSAGLYLIRITGERFQAAARVVRAGR